MLFLVLAVGGDIVWHRKGVSHWGGSLVQGTGQLYSSWSLLDPGQYRNKLQFLLWHEGRGAASTALPVAQLPSFTQCWCCWAWIAPQNLLPSREDAWLGFSLGPAGALGPFLPLQLSGRVRGDCPVPPGCGSATFPLSWDTPGAAWRAGSGESWNCRMVWGA